MTVWSGLVVFIAIAVALWLVSLAVDALRPVPTAPGRLRWAPDMPVEFVNAGGHRLRYIKVGRGPNLVLLHTLRTQLDMFEKVVEPLADSFTVYALDYPGHGFSDIPKARYDAAFFIRSVEQFLDALDLREVTLAGVSIGGAIALNIAARRNARLARVVAINPYDYARGRGMARSSLLGWVTTYVSNIPIVGETYMRLRSFPIMKAVLLGGVADHRSISAALLREMYLVGNRRGHYSAFLSLLRNSPSWEIASKNYRSITVPVRLVWGDADWARLSERKEDHRLLGGVPMVTVAHGGHFLPLDRPDAIIEQIKLAAGV